MDIHNMINILQKAQNTYGYSNQINVAMEELAELIAVIAKYPRYPDHTTAMEDKEFRAHVIEETADVVIVLNHLYMIFEINLEEQEGVINKKLARLERWLNTSPKFSHTMKDRGIE